MDKIFITAGQLLADSFRLAAKIHASGFKPELIAAVWRGGTPVGIAVQEYLEYRGVTAEHYPVKTASYAGIDQRSRTISVSLPGALVDRLRPEAALLIVDDVFDTGLSLHELIVQLRSEAGNELPRELRIACPWYKPRRNRTDLAPHYFLHQTEQWLVFPHELSGLAPDEIRRGKTDLSGVLDELDLG